MALDLGADSLLFARAMGVIPAADSGGFPSMPYAAAIVGVTTTVVPLPGAALLFAPALLALLGIGRAGGRRRAGC